MQTVILRTLGADDPPLDRSTASPFALLDLEKGRWSEELCDLLSIPSDRLSPLTDGGEVVGELSHSAAQATGLLHGTPLVLGGGDQACAAIGAGAIHPQDCFIGLGTGACVMVSLDNPVRDPLCTISCLFHAIPGKYGFEGHTQASAAVFKWFRDEFGHAEVAAAVARDAYDLMTEKASHIAPGADGLIFLPMFNGSTQPEVHPEARGALVGLSFKHTRSHVIRALLEGISLEIRWIIERINEIVGGIQSVYLAGGASRSEVWNQINADILNLPIHCLEMSDAAVLGAAIQAGVAVGIFADIEAATKSMIRIRKTYLPCAQTSDYDVVFDRFMKTYRTLLRINPRYSRNHFDPS
jgi:xylulokinase